MIDNSYTESAHITTPNRQPIILRDHFEVSLRFPGWLCLIHSLKTTSIKRLISASSFHTNLKHFSPIPFLSGIYVMPTHTIIITRILFSGLLPYKGDTKGQGCRYNSIQNFNLSNFRVLPLHLEGTLAQCLQLSLTT